MAGQHLLCRFTRRAGSNVHVIESQLRCRVRPSHCKATSFLPEGTVNSMVIRETAPVSLEVDEIFNV